MSQETILLKQYIKALESENSSKNTERTTLESQIKTILEQNNKLREKISSLPSAKQLDAYKKQIKHLKDTQKKKQSQMEHNKQNTLMNTHNELTIKNKQIKQLTQQLGHLKQTLEQVSKQYQESKTIDKQQIRSLKQKIDFKIQRITQLEKQRDESRKELDSVKAEYNKQVGKLQGFYESELIKIQQESDKMRSSRIRKDCCIEFGKTKQELNNTIKHNLVLQNELSELREQICVLKENKSNNNFLSSRPLRHQNMNMRNNNKWTSLQMMINNIRQTTQELLQTQ